MIKLVALGIAVAPIYSDYPSFLRRDAIVEAYTDLGPIVEMIVKCPQGTGIMSYSKIERLYCSSKNACFPGLHDAVDDTCGSSRRLK